MPDIYGDFLLSFSSSFNVPSLMGGALGLAGVVSLVISIIFLFHWKRYRVSAAVPSVIVTLYFVVLATALGAMTLSYLSFVDLV